MLEYTFIAELFLNFSLVSSRKGFIPSSQAFPIKGSRGIFPNNGTFISFAKFSAPPENKCQGYSYNYNTVESRFKKDFGSDENLS